MKKIISLICSILISCAIQAQTIHWITFIDTTDPNVGQIDVYGRQMLYSYFINEVNAALAPKGYKTDIQDFNGYQVSPENCKAAINMLRISDPDDIIVFYYIGHGGRPTTDSDYMRTHPYPQMCLAQHDENKFIPLEWVDKQLKSKGARLSVTIGMCCNNLDNRISIKDEPNFSPNYGATYMSENKLSKIQELFLNTKGSVIATSASPSQTSGCFEIYQSMIPNPAQYRDRYSYAICSFFQTQLDNYTKTLTWDNFLSAISWFVDKYSKGEQTPIHDISIAQEPVKEKQPEIPTDTEIQKTKEKQTANATKKQGDDNSQSNWINELSNHLSTLINTNIPLSKRQELEQKLNNLFAYNAKIKFLGQDSEKVIDRSNASDWLGILATNPKGRIIKIIVSEGTFGTDNKISSLKVKEVYKK